MKESIQELKRRIGIPNLRWWMLSFFILVMIFNYVDRASISIALPLIMKDLGFKAIVSGIVLSAFFWSYTFMQMPGGWLVDKLGPRKIVSTSIIGWGVAEAITGLASSTGALIFLRVLLGTLEGPVQVGMNTSMTKWLRREERGRGSTLIDGGGQLADRWRKTESRVNLVMRTLLGIAGLLVAVAVIFVNYVESAVAAGILLSITNFFLRWGGLYWSVPPMLAEEGHVGRLSGAMNFAGNVAGIAIPIVVGWIFTVTNSFSGVFLLFGICGLVMAGASVVLDYSRTLSR